VAADDGGAVSFFLPTVDSLALVGQAEGIALGSGDQPPVDQVR